MPELFPAVSPPDYVEPSSVEVMHMIKLFKQELDKVRAENLSLRTSLDEKDGQIRLLVADVSRKDDEIRELVAETNRKDGEIRNLLEGLKTRAEELKNVPTYRLKKRDASRDERERQAMAKYKATLGNDYLRWAWISSIVGIIFIALYRHYNPHETFLGPTVSVFVLIIGLLFAGWKELREAQAMNESAKAIGDYIGGLENSMEDLFQRIAEKGHDWDRIQAKGEEHESGKLRKRG